MILFLNLNGQLDEVNEKPFKLEKEIQKIFEENLDSIMGLILVKSEFTIKNKRIDSLAYDQQCNAFVIIEYKRDRNISVVDQGFTYLGLMLDNKAEFILEYNESMHQTLSRDGIDWGQSKVIFVSTSFTENQILATNFSDIGIELWEIKQFENDTILINPIKKTATAPSIKPITQKSESLKKITSQLTSYSEEEHFAKSSDAMVDLYLKFKAAILNLADDIEVKPLRVRINFRKGKRLYADIALLKNGLKIWINAKKGTLDDPKLISTDVSNVGHWGNGDYQLDVTDDQNLEYIMSLLKQVINQKS